MPEPERPSRANFAQFVERLLGPWPCDALAAERDAYTLWRMEGARAIAALCAEEEDTGGGGGPGG